MSQGWQAEQQRWFDIAVICCRLPNHKKIDMSKSQALILMCGITILNSSGRIAQKDKSNSGVRWQHLCVTCSWGTDEWRHDAGPETYKQNPVLNAWRLRAALAAAKMRSPEKREKKWKIGLHAAFQEITLWTLQGMSLKRPITYGLKVRRLCRGIWMSSPRPTKWGSKRSSATFCPWVTTTSCNTTAWRRVGGKVPIGEGPGALVLSG